jgi:hypothetical protein
MAKAQKVRDIFWQLTESRAFHWIGDVPDEVVQAAKAAEYEFASEAAAHLDQI